MHFLYKAKQDKNRNMNDWMNFKEKVTTKELNILLFKVILANENDFSTLTILKPLNVLRSCLTSSGLYQWFIV